MGEYKKVRILADYGSIELARKVHSELQKRDIPGGLHDFDDKSLCISRFKNSEIDVVVESNESSSLNHNEIVPSLVMPIVLKFTYMS